MDSEVVFRKTEDGRTVLSTYDNDHTTPVPTDKAWTVWKNRDKVAVVTGRLMTGKPRQNLNKRYWYWESVESYGFYRTRSGLAQPYLCDRPDGRRSTPWRGRYPEKAVNMLDPDSDEGMTEMGQAFRVAMRDTFSVRNLFDIYPMAEHFGLNRYAVMPANLRNAMRSDTVQTFSEKVFGKNRSSNIFVKTVQKTDPYFISLAHEFRGLVKDTRLRSFLADSEWTEEIEETFEIHTPWFRDYAVLLNEDSRNNLLYYSLDNMDIRRISNLAGRPRARGHRLKPPLGYKVDKNKVYKNWSDLFTELNGHDNPRHLASWDQSF